MQKFAELYSIAVATAMLGKNTDEEIGEYLCKNYIEKIKIIKKLQPIVMDFSISDEEAAKKVGEILKESNLE